MVSVNFSVGKPYSVYNYIELQISRLKRIHFQRKNVKVYYIMCIIMIFTFLMFSKYNCEGQPIEFDKVYFVLWLCNQLEV